MNKRPATRRHSYDATERKTFRNSLCHLLQTEFPGHQTGRVFGLYVMVQHAGVATGLVLATPLFALVSERTGIAACALALAASGVAGLARFGVRS